ncbi:DMT family transporter [Candidatus Dojkabacteria bacterium]|uniref:DMT family transporter n=1 Tax=Candidatus Dojkabacteria bacterium TaxID=2099670 RepID=A0A955RKJ7_9BACT|nr:DMT family transporter [Candidatus Dojkabacteria bacterium]
MKNKLPRLVLIGAAFLYATAGVFDRTLSAEVSVYMQVLIRTALSVLLFISIVFLKRVQFRKIERKDWKYLIAQGVLSFSGFIFFIQAVTKIPIGLTLFTFYSGILISVFIYSSFIFKEKVTKTTFTALCLSSIGLVIMFLNSLETYSLYGFIFAFIAGCGFGLNFPVSKHVSDKYSHLQINTTVFFVSFILSTCTVFLTGTTITFSYSIGIWVAFILYSITIILAYFACIYGFQHTKTQIASLTLLLEVVFAVVIGYLVYREIPTLHTTIGGILILISQILINIKPEVEKPVQ